MRSDTLTREQIVTAAIDLLDTEGLQGLNMRALGKRLGAAATVLTFVLGNALGPAAAASLTRKLSRAGGNVEELLRERMAKAREIATQFPRLRVRLNTAAAQYAAAPENSFEFGLRAVLDGLEAQLIARRTP